MPCCPMQGTIMFSFINLAPTIFFLGKSMGTDKILFRQVIMSRNGARVLPLEVVPVPRHGAKIFAWAPTKSYIQTRCLCLVLGAQAPSLNG